MRLINADELIEHAWRDKLDSRELILKMIEQAPTIKEPKTGHWIDTDYEGFSPCMCSECKTVEFKRSLYCPNCGCYMVEPQKEGE